MIALETLWWLFFWTALGLCVGSFLNVVIYRLPRDRSLYDPRRSMCPNCGSRIHWYDNLPLLSFVQLGGRCRKCDAAIATHYVVIEAATALVVLILLDAFFIGRIRSGLSTGRFGLTEQLAYDWPIFLAHIILFSCLLAMSAIDMEHYWVDVRFTNAAVICGFVLHTIWNPKHTTTWIRPADTTAVMSLMAMAGLAFVGVILVCRPCVRRPHAESEDCDEPEQTEAEPSPAEVTFLSRHRPMRTPPRKGAWAFGLTFLALFVFVAWAAVGGRSLVAAFRVGLPLALFFILIVHQSMVVRESDEQIVTAIHEERHNARRMVLNELATLLPAVVLGLVGVWVMAGEGEFAERISQALHRNVRLGSHSLWRNGSPYYGLATAASGYILGGAIGWTVRIGATLLFGKEAFGTGDIHFMAAAGCIAGWPVVLLGLFLTCFMAVAGWLLTLPFKRTHAIPLGPWLSLSFLIVVVFYDAILRWPVIARMITSMKYLLFSTNSQLSS